MGIFCFVINLSHFFFFNLEIICSVCEHDLRPQLDEHKADEAVLQMVHRCWHVVPEERPDFVTLQSIIRRINK